MAAPTITVDVALGLAGPTDFILDDPMRGVLDGTSYTLATGFTAVTSDSVSASITRGRFSQLWDGVDAGHANVRLNNEDRDYDPAHMLSPYSGYIVPGREVRIEANSMPIWTGIVSDWDLEYEVGGRSTATMSTTDALGVLSGLQFDAWTSSGVRVEQKLQQVVNRAEVAWRGPTAFDAGSEVLQADSVTWGSNVGSYCQLVGRSDLGMLFAARDGTLTFRNRSAVGDTSIVTFSDAGGVFDAPLRDDDGEPMIDGDGEPLTAPVATVPFATIGASIGSELLFSRAGVDREGGTAQSATVASPSAWQDSYGPLRSLTVTGLLLATNAQALDMAEYLLLLYDTPRYRITEISVLLHSLDEGQQEAVLAIDIASVVTVGFTPNGVGTQIVQPLLVQGIRHEIAPMSHRVTFSLVAGSEPFFRLDDATYGVLDVGLLAF